MIAHFRGTGKTIIGKNSWIVACCTILDSPGQVLTLCEGAVLAAGAVVTEDVPP